MQKFDKPATLPHNIRNDTMSSIGMTSPFTNATILSAMEMFRTTSVTVTYAPPAFRSSGTKY